VVAAFLHPWSGTAFRRIPARSRYDVLDTRFAALAADNRWNEAGEPTFYLAGDLGVALAEYARHLREDVGLTGTPPVHERAVYQLDVRLQAVLDLRDPAVRSAVGLHGGVRRFLDRGVARATAHFVRRTTPAEAVLVPSIAFIDDISRWNLVLFLDKLPSELSDFMNATFDRTVRIAR
jgi:RES domain-containing protein